MTDNTPTTKQDEGDPFCVCCCRPKSEHTAKMQCPETTYFIANEASPAIALDDAGERFAQEIEARRETVRQAIARHRLRTAPATPPHNEDGLRKAFIEGAWAGWRSGLAGEQMDDDYARRSFAASDTRQALGDIPSG